MSNNNKSKILALDIGKSKSGVAISDIDEKMAFLRPEIFHKSTEEFFMRLGEIIEKENIKKIVIGYPLNLAGKKTEQTNYTDSVIQLIKKSYDIELIEMDERYSSKQAEDMHLTKISDSNSALILLETYLRMRELIPGNSFPSKNSSIAPPPVET